MVATRLKCSRQKQGAHPEVEIQTPHLPSEVPGTVFPPWCVSLLHRHSRRALQPDSANI